MPAVLLNCAVVLVCGGLGLALKERLPQKLLDGLMQAMGLCVMVIGIDGAVSTNNMLCVLVCLVAGTVIGTLLDIEGRLDRLGEALRRRFDRGGSGSFTQGFVTASLMFCVGAMAIVGSIQAGLEGDWSILLSKTVIDGVTSVSLAAALGAGVLFAAAPLLVYQGGVVLLAGLLSGVLSDAVVGEMSAVGGVLILALGINMLSMSKAPMKAGNMLPAIFLPPFYLALTGILA